MDKKLQQLLKGFSALGHEEKKQKLIEMLEFIKDKIDFTKGILQFMKEGNPSDQFLEQNYTMIMKATIESNNKQLLNHIETIHSMKEKENKERETEEKDADNILNSI